MANIPDNAIIRRVKNGMERNGKLNNPKRGAKMSPCCRNGINSFGAEFIGEVRELLSRKIS
ncbi:hypothetical protein AA15669_0489 [Saccharibacter floricola DSM 15669]|uniref:Uncharacterized protein n=1 Tax=Saccharibacter floricola DSM 15669 TaxID=1123227 RepID=A0ABQ0NX16_9PROT|nr:hypothetical protein AA15669_0489 [Saccharibacter floricola DSM 15669]